MSYLSTMRTTAAFMAALLLANAAGAGTTGDSTYTLTGKIDGMNTGWVFLMHIQSAKGILDSVKSDKQGRFTFTGKITTPELCGFAIYGTSGNREFRTYFFLQGGHTTVNGAKQSMANAVVEGGPVRTEFHQYGLVSKEWTEVQRRGPSPISGRRFRGLGLKSINVDQSPKNRPKVR